MENYPEIKSYLLEHCYIDDRSNYSLENFSTKVSIFLQVLGGKMLSSTCWSAELMFTHGMMGV